MAFSGFSYTPAFIGVGHNVIRYKFTAFSLGQALKNRCARFIVDRENRCVAAFPDRIDLIIGCQPRCAIPQALLDAFDICNLFRRKLVMLIL
jgi:hypothetical protein